MYSNNPQFFSTDRDKTTTITTFENFIVEITKKENDRNGTGEPCTTYDYHFFLPADPKKKIGFCKCRVWTDEEKDFISMTHIEVDAGFRRQGFGTTILKFVVENARKWDKGIWINAIEPAKKFYEKAIPTVCNYPDFVFPEDGGHGYHCFMIEKKRLLQPIEQSNKKSCTII